MYNLMSYYNKYMNTSTPINRVDALQGMVRLIPIVCKEHHELVKRVKSLEAENADLTKENSNQKRVIHILENKVLELKGKPVPMEPRLPTCDALVHPRPTLQSNRSNAKEAGE